ncbi:MAG: glycosyltransferase family 4 protein [Planctomycetes bacterium]|nr:glycosyltransferase family 4 protein [Planctomycetota bacterium]
MRIAIATAYPTDPASPDGGVEAVSVNLVGALARLEGVDLHVVTTDAGRREPAVFSDGPVTMHRLPRHGWRTLTGAVGAGRWHLKHYLRMLAPDVVHAHDIYGLMVKGLAVPRVFTVHGFIHADTAVSGTPAAWLRSHLWRRVEVAGWADQPHIIAISPYVRRRLTGLTLARIHDIDNPVGEAYFDIPRREQPVTILSTAVISPRKNTLALIEAFALLVERGHDVRLRLAGSSRWEDYFRRVTHRLADPRLARRVDLLGTIPAEHIRRELAAASIYALTSLEENAPMGIAEAMAAGVPVVASNRCGMPYMVREGESGYLVDPTDVRDIARRLELLVTRPDRREAMGARGRRIALERFHPAVVAQRTMEVYRLAVGQGVVHAGV